MYLETDWHTTLARPAWAFRSSPVSLAGASTTGNQPLGSWRGKRAAIVGVVISGFQEGSVLILLALVETLLLGKGRCLHAHPGHILVCGVGKRRCLHAHPGYVLVCGVGLSISFSSAPALRQTRGLKRPGSPQASLATFPKPSPLFWVKDLTPRYQMLAVPQKPKRRTIA